MAILANVQNTISQNTRTYQRCTRCVMDTTDPEIQFDENGVCNHCRGYEALAQKLVIPESERQAALDRLVTEIKSKGRGREYDCIIGVSGGVDSTYVAYLVKKLGLRPLAVHLDNGWDSELAVGNIEKILRKLGIDLYTHVLDWEEFKQLQIAFLKASTPDSEVPTDHAISAILYREAARRKVPYLIIGVNTATEGIHASQWSYGHNDWRYISAINSRFGLSTISNFPHYSLFNMFYYSLFPKIQMVRILDYIQYNKEEAMRVLEEDLGWRPYGGKHYESIYTRFFQGYILPKKFGIDKRKMHLSTLIMSGQISRDEAMAELENPPYAGYMMEEDMEYVLKKFGFTQEEFQSIMTIPARSYKDFPNSERLFKIIRNLRITTLMRKLKLMPAKSQ
jgi:N-acetyl sugar amidotransferase